MIAAQRIGRARYTSLRISREKGLNSEGFPHLTKASTAAFKATTSGVTPLALISRITPSTADKRRCRPYPFSKTQNVTGPVFNRNRKISYKARFAHALNIARTKMAVSNADNHEIEIIVSLSASNGFRTRCSIEVFYLLRIQKTALSPEETAVERVTGIKSNILMAVSGCCRQHLPHIRTSGIRGPKKVDHIFFQIPWLTEQLKNYSLIFTSVIKSPVPALLINLNPCHYRQLSEEFDLPLAIRCAPIRDVISSASPMRPFTAHRSNMMEQTCCTVEQSRP